MIHSLLSLTSWSLAFWLAFFVLALRADEVLDASFGVKEVYQLRSRTAGAKLPPKANISRPDGAIRLPPKEKFHLFLLIGQSNMAGRGKIHQSDRKPHPRLLSFTQQNRWAPAVDPLHFDKPKIVGVGLGRSFGLQIVKQQSDITVGLIPCAVGGSPISSWAPGGFHQQTNTHPYDDMLRRTKSALRFGALKGILWHQGESDSQPENAKVYEKKLYDLVRRLRKDLNTPNVPFIAGQMGKFAERPWSDAQKLVDMAHRNLPTKIALAGFVESNGLRHKGDQVHFDAASCRELGKRYAKAYQRLTAKRQTNSGN